MATLPGHGYSYLSATAASTVTMAGPAPGTNEKVLFCTIATSQGVVLESGNYRTTAGSSFTRATFETPGQSLRLIPLSSALYGVINNQGTVLFSTST